MANPQKKKSPQKSNNQAVTIQSTRRSREIAGIILAAVGVLLLFALFGKAGIVGRLIRNLLFGLFGGVTTVLMLCLLFAVAWCIIRNTAERVFALRNCILFGVLLLLVAALVHTVVCPARIYSGMHFGEVVSALWNRHAGGGVIGGGLSIVLQKLVARPGAFVLLIPATTVITMILFSLSVVNFARRLAGIGQRVAYWFGSVRARFRADRVAAARQENAEPAQNTRSRGAGTDAVDRYLQLPENADPEEDPSGADDEEDEIEFVSVAHKRRTGFTGRGAGRENAEESEAVASAAHAETTEPDPESEARDVPAAEISKSDATERNAKDSDEIRLVTADDTEPYIQPPFSMLIREEEPEDHHDEQRRQATRTARKLEEVMRSFGIEARVIHISRGSTVTMYELQPHSGVKVSKIKNLSDDIAMNLAASGIRIEAPIPGKAAIGIEIPNKEKRTVYLKELIETEEFLHHKSKLAFCLGEDISGAPVIADIAKMPHLLIAGTTGSGKSVCVNCMIISLLFRASPNDVRLIMIDPKVVELQMYNGIPHLLIPVVTEPKKAAAALAWAVQEMENRYRQFAKCNIRDIQAYNEYAPEHGLPKLPRIVIIIDELADLMMVVRDSIEEAINRIAQKARAAGMHLIVATQRPSVDVITGLIKANIPSRIAFAVSSQVDSKTILDYGGAEKLLGRGDMLYYLVGSMKATRVQGGFVSDGEIENIVEFLKNSLGEAEYDDAISSEIENARPMEKSGRRGGAALSGAAGGTGAADDETLLRQAVDIAIETKQISASFLQRRLGLGYARAARLIDLMEERGYISARDGNNPRQVLINRRPEHDEE